MNKIKKMKGGENIPLYTLTSSDWHNQGMPPSYAVNLDVGINEYIFGRTTPDNKFVVATGLNSSDFNNIEMIGGKKVSNKKVSDKKVSNKKVTDKKVTDKKK